MAGFVDNVITTAGFKCITDALLGKELEFTRIKMGSGEIPEGVDSRTLDDLVHVEAIVEISKCEAITDNQVVVGGLFDNEDCDKGFEYRELGLFARDADSGQEVMFSYGNCGRLCEHIPPSQSATLITKQIDIITYVGSTTQVRVELTNGLYLSMDDFNRWKDKLEAVLNEYRCKCMTPLKNDEFLAYVMDGEPVRDDSGDVEKEMGDLKLPDLPTIEQAGQEPSAGTNDYNKLKNKPAINGVTLEGDKPSTSLGLAGADDYITSDEIDALK